MDDAYEHKWLFESKKPEVTNEVIDTLFCDAVKKFGTTLEKLNN
jgi:hypothetical protein